jgi:hypothetical protein
MGKVTAGATVSLDGYIAGPNETGFEHLFAWLNAGEHEFPSANPEVSFHLSEADQRFFREANESVGSTSSGAGCSTSPTAGAASTRSTSRSSS